MTDPLEPGHIPGQNPSTPERLPAHTKFQARREYSAGILYVAVAIALMLGLALILAKGSRAADSSTPTSDVMQTVAYFGGAILLGAAIAYGIMRSRARKPSSTQASATRALYDEEERDRQGREDAARKSSRPIDVIERKTDTTG